VWIPDSAGEIEHAARNGDLTETAGFDAKAALPPAKKNSETAADVAAMSTDGGSLLFGVAEDENRRPTVPTPIDLRGTRERIDQIVAHSIAEPPYVDFREYPTDVDPAQGYLLVIVPQSARAPHQVTVGGDLRFYGRGETGNRRLTEGEIARLYERRQRWEVDRDAYLTEIVSLAPHDQSLDKEYGYLHAFARPVVLDQALWDRAVGDDRRALLQRLTHAASATGPNTGYVPSLRGLADWKRRGADAWSVEVGRGSLVGLRCDVNIDGRGYLFCLRAAQRMEDGLGIFEQIIAGNLASFLSIMGEFYEAGGYHGQVDIGLAVTGIEGGLSMRHGSLFTSSGEGFRAPTYTRTDRVAAGGLREPEAAAWGLVRHLVTATAGEGYDPLT
jgi:hypothetical protein